MWLIIEYGHFSDQRTNELSANTIQSTKFCTKSLIRNLSASHFFDFIFVYYVFAFISLVNKPFSPLSNFQWQFFAWIHPVEKNICHTIDNDRVHQFYCSVKCRILRDTLPDDNTVRRTFKVDWPLVGNNRKLYWYVLHLPTNHHQTIKIPG